ncbi:cubilin [Caerostris extrusa]|uniref:Cubilin n=1 Tax=Caerostris extrusa TaxID=172846 RepID=A0AAV4TY36_CAEEX|nr:cubilin [Caerostris extrusa]
MGTPTPNTVCSYTVYSDQKREGEMMSPTYLASTLRTSAAATTFSERGFNSNLVSELRRECPIVALLIFVKIYDGESEEYPLINTYCGQQRNLVVFSSSENLYVKFVTLQRNADNSNRGFKAAYEFSERFVSLECDQKILSKGVPTVWSAPPTIPYPYHPNVVCRYYVYGMQDAQRLERVRLKFEKFEIPVTTPTTSMTPLTPTCTDGFLRIYLQGQEERYALDEFDQNLCGLDLPPSFKSEGPRLVMIFKSGSTQGTGFKAQYHFEADYQVPGTASPNGSCQFFYRSESQKSGDFNSPHLSCQLPFFHTICQEDWLEMYEVYPSGRERLLGRYCGRTAPGPIMSALGVDTMKVILHTDDKNVASGFTATYEFFPADTRYVDCGRNISELTEGVLLSPGFPVLTYPVFKCAIGSSPSDPTTGSFCHSSFFPHRRDPERRGCPGAVVRVYPELSEPPMELCGESLANHSREVISSSNIMKITFVTADKAVGAKGFQATWTEIKEGTKCDQFQCSLNKYCISESAKCNGLPNCGLDDISDEVDCLAIHGIDIHLIIGLSFGGAIITVITMCAIFHRKCKRRRTPSDTQHHRNQPKMAATPHTSQYRTTSEAHGAICFPQTAIVAR